MVRRDGGAVTCGVGMEQCSPQGMEVSPAPHFTPHSTYLITPFTSSFFWTQLGGGGFVGERIGAQRGGVTDRIDG